jgi:hypothetical protein
LGGLAPLYIDWNWLRAVTDDALVRLPRNLRTRLFHVLDETTDLDPAFFQAYTVGGNLLAIVRDDVFGARDLLEKGVRFLRDTLPGEDEALKTSTWRETWRINMQLGYVYLFELEDIPAAERFFIKAADHPDAPLYVRNLGNRLRQPEGRFIVARNLLSNFLAGATEKREPPAVIRELEEKLRSLELAQFFFRINLILEKGFAGQNRGKQNMGTDSPQGQLATKGTLFEKLKKSGMIPMLDPAGAPLRLEATPEQPNGTLVSSTARTPVFGF